jgi:hypothetical protein
MNLINPFLNHSYSSGQFVDLQAGRDISRETPDMASYARWRIDSFYRDPIKAATSDRNDNQLLTAAHNNALPRPHYQRQGTPEFCVEGETN